MSAEAHELVQRFGVTLNEAESIVDAQDEKERSKRRQRARVWLEEERKKS